MASSSYLLVATFSDVSITCLSSLGYANSDEAANSVDDEFVTWRHFPRRISCVKNNTSLQSDNELMIRRKALFPRVPADCRRWSEPGLRRRRRRTERSIRRGLLWCDGESMPSVAGHLGLWGPGGQDSPRPPGDEGQPGLKEQRTLRTAGDVQLWTS